MGQWSYLDCITQEQVLDFAHRDVYLLVPEKFADKYGPRIVEHCYDGYGHFGKYDVYEVVAEWNREMIPEIIRRGKAGTWYNSIGEEDIIALEAYYEGKPIPAGLSGFKFETRWIGILMSCYDQDNFALEYPVKVTYDPHAVYENCSPSYGDVHQGWPATNEDDDDPDEYLSLECSDDEEDPDKEVS